MTTPPDNVERIPDGLAPRTDQPAAQAPPSRKVVTSLAPLIEVARTLKDRDLLAVKNSLSRYEIVDLITAQQFMTDCKTLQTLLTDALNDLSAARKSIASDLERLRRREATRRRGG